MAKGLTKDDVVNIVREVISEMGKAQASEQKGKELEQVMAEKKALDGNDKLSDDERAMFGSLIGYKEAFIVAKYDDPARLDKHVEEQRNYDKENNIQSIKISTNDGRSVVELRVNPESIGEYNKLQQGTAQYWETLTRMLNGEK